MAEKLPLVDQNGRPLTPVDPTENVKALAAAGFERQDKMLLEVTKRLEADIEHVKEIGVLGRTHLANIDAIRSSYVKDSNAFIAAVAASFMNDQKELIKANAQAEGKRQGLSSIGALIAGAAAVLVALIAIGSFIFINRAPVQQAQQPQVVYQQPLIPEKAK
jgi:hypothetical protein